MSRLPALPVVLRSAGLLVALVALHAAGPAHAALQVDTIAGNGTAGFAGDGGPATQAQLNAPFDVVSETGGRFLVADRGNHVVRRIAQDGTITTIAGTAGSPGNAGDGGPATSAQLNDPTGVLSLPGGDVLIADRGNNRVRRVDGTTGVISNFAGDPSGVGGIDPRPAVAAGAAMSAPTDLAFGSSGSVLVTDAGNGRVSFVSAGGVLDDVAGGGGSGADDIPALTANLGATGAVTNASADGVPFTTPPSGRLRRVDAGGTLRAVNGGLSGPSGVTRGLSDVLVSDTGGHVVRGVAAGRVIAGDGTAGFAGDGGPPELARLNGPAGLAGIADGFLVADSANHRIRAVRDLPAAPATAAPDPPALPPVAGPSAPVLGASATVAVRSGRVTVRVPGTDRFVALTAATTLRDGTEVDATAGITDLTSATPGGGRQTAQVRGGRFVLDLRGDGLANLRLSEPLAGCVAARAPRAASAQAAQRRKRQRRLKVRGRGRFGTSGRYGSAIVRGTRWSTIDTCGGSTSRTTVVVFEGAVDVRDARTRRVTRTRAGRVTILRARPR